MKKQGELAEMRFLLNYMERDMPVSIPFGDNQKYDCIVDGKDMHRVQIKSTSRRDRHKGNVDRYHLLIASGNKSKTPYKKCDIDILAVYIIPMDRWYILPIDAVDGRKTINLYPHNNSKGKYEKYLDAWDLL